MIPFEEFGFTQSEVDKNMIFIVDIGSKQIEYASPMAHLNLGYGKGELLELSAYDLHPHEMEEMSNFIDLIYRDKKAHSDSLHCLAKNGSVIPARIAGEIQTINERNFMVARVVLKEEETGN